MTITESNPTGAHLQLLADFAGLAERLRQSTVQVKSVRGGGRGGSGVVWRDDGLIITNAHVVRSERAQVQLADARVFDARVTSRDEAHDLAALTIQAQSLPAVTVGDSGALRVGELALAVGNPLGHVGALTTGIIHAKSQRWVAADVRLAPGNSGGLLANARGEVVGINSMIARGLALAVPSREVERFLARRKGGERPRLGINFQPVVVPVAEGQTLGLLLPGVQQASAAERAGLMIGDILIGVGGQRFQAPDDLAVALDRVDEDGTLGLELLRGGKRLAVTVTFDTSASAAEAA
ncbi:MAG TPA: trypsin-like peptidase domain-containing protein [Blastocatellia bacterium]|nr:trypsin-like peptidase domain-containing protein [Blastocatellia bacterium]